MGRFAPIVKQSQNRWLQVVPLSQQSTPLPFCIDMEDIMREPEAGNWYHRLLALRYLARQPVSCGQLKAGAVHARFSVSFQSTKNSGRIAPSETSFGIAREVGLREFGGGKSG